MDNLIFLDLDEAIRADVARFAGTRDELSRRVCGSAQALRHKLAGFKGQFLRPDELIDLMLHSGGRHTVASMAAAVGGVFLMLPEVNADIDRAELEQKMAAVAVRLGALFAQMTQATADGQIDAGERLALDARAHDLQAAVQEWLLLSYRLYVVADDGCAEKNAV